MIAKGSDCLPTDGILQKVSDLELLSFFFGVTTIPCKIRSLLRKDDNPSMFISEKNGRVVWYDFGLGRGGNVIDLIKEYFNIDYKEALNKIYKEFILNNERSGKTIKPCTIVSSVKHNKAKIECTQRDWNNKDKEYWQQFGISLDVLDWANVHPISYFMITKDGYRYVIKADEYAYVYVEFKEGNTTYKIYQPYNDNNMKWISNHDKSVLSLWQQMPTSGDKIIICSSMKDALCLMCAMYPKYYPCIALQGEAFPMSETAINELKRRFNKQYILLDNDVPGIEDAKRLEKLTGFTNIEIPQFDGGKDLAEFYQLYGKENFVSLINSLI